MRRPRFAAWMLACLVLTLDRATGYTFILWALIGVALILDYLEEKFGEIDD